MVPKALVDELWSFKPAKRDRYPTELPTIAGFESYWGTNISNFLGINKMQECQATNCQAKATSTISINKPILQTFKLLNEGNKINVCNRHAKNIKKELEHNGR